MKRKDSFRRSESGAVAELGDKVLPHNLDAERSVLGALLIDSVASVAVFQLLTPEDFYSPRHGRLYEAFQRVYDAESTVDPVMVCEELEREGVMESVGGAEVLDKLMEGVYAVANAEYYAKIVREKSMLRALVAACSETIQDVCDSALSVGEQLDSAEHRVFEVAQRGIGPDFLPISSILTEQFKKFDQRSSGEDCVFSGYKDLDDMTSGFSPAEFIIVAGRPSMGKTTFCMNVVEHAAMQSSKRIAIFSLEMSKDQLVQNLLCSHSRVDAHRLRQRSLSHGQWQILIDGAERLSGAKILIDDTPGITPLTMKAKARRLHAREPLDLIVIDYLQLMEAGDRRESRQQEISTVSRSLKALARELNVPVVAISQLSRGVENRESHRPRLSDLRESGAIEQDADLVLLLYREEYYHPKKEEAKGKAEVIIAKQRNGPIGSVELTFISRYMKFESFSRYEEDPFNG